jgi:hypothetical protein
MISWETCRREFAPDGGLRDIYVFDTTIEHWRKLIRILMDFSDFECCIDGNVRPIPSNVEEIFKLAGASALMRFQSAGVTFVLHFFCLERIELDIVPREVNSETTFNGLISVLKSIGDGLKKPVIVTYESDERCPFITYEPSKKEFVYSPCQTTR